MRFYIYILKKRLVTVVLVISNLIPMACAGAVISTQLIQRSTKRRVDRFLACHDTLELIVLVSPVFPSRFHT